MAKISSYKELLVWQKSIVFVNQIYSVSKDFPSAEKFVLVSQITRAAISIPSNIAEGWGRESLKNFIQFLRISRGSVYEVETLLIIARNQNYIEEKKFNAISDELTEISKMLNSLIKKLEAKLTKE